MLWKSSYLEPSSSDPNKSVPLIWQATYCSVSTRHGSVGKGVGACVGTDVEGTDVEGTGVGRGVGDVEGTSVGFGDVEGAGVEGASVGAATLSKGLAVPVTAS